MSWTLHWSKAAQEDLIDIWLYIAADNPPAADRQISRIEAAVDRLADYPRLGPARDDVGQNVRGIIQNRYLIIYRLQISSNTVELLRVIDGARDLSALFIGGER